MSAAGAEDGMDEWMAAGLKLRARAPEATRWLAERLLELEAIDADARAYDDACDEFERAYEKERSVRAAARPL